MSAVTEPNPTTNVDDPQRSSSTDDPFSGQRGDEAPPSPTTQKRDRRMSKEWDAAKTVPSQFQKRKGSVYATPSSRDGHVDSGKNRDKSFHDKLKEKGWLK